MSDSALSRIVDSLIARGNIPEGSRAIAEDLVKEVVKTRVKRITRKSIEGYFPVPKQISKVCSLN